MHHGGPYPGHDRLARDLGRHRRDPSLRAAGLLPGLPEVGAARGAARREPARASGAWSTEALPTGERRVRARLPASRSRSSTRTPRASRRASSSAGWPELEGADDGRAARGARWRDQDRSGAARRLRAARPRRDRRRAADAARRAAARSRASSSSTTSAPLWMCGHGTIGVVRTLEHLGRHRARAQVRLDTPGRHRGRRARRGRRRHDRERAGASASRGTSPWTCPASGASSGDVA